MPEAQWKVLSSAVVLQAQRMAVVLRYQKAIAGALFAVARLGRH